jgi:hypothetical protein
MLTIKLHEDYHSIMAFDGTVLEFYLNRRIHVSQIQNIQILTDRHGHHKLRLDIPGGFSDLDLDEKAFPKVTQVIADIQKAKAEFRFDQGGETFS